MVATVGGDDRFQSATPAAPIPLKDLPPVVKWTPRSGRTAQYKEWEFALKQACMAVGFTYSELPVPSPALGASFTSANNTRQSVKQEDEAEARFLAEFAAWQRANTALYAWVAASLELQGTWAEVDRRAVRAFQGDHAADGNGVIEWARAFASVASLDARGKLIANVASMRLPAGSSLVALHRHCELMFEQWLLVPPNSPDNLIAFWDQLMLSIPSQPVASHLTTVRTWLAERVEAYRAGTSQLCSSVDATIVAMVQHARAVGLPEGKPADAAAVDSSMLHAVIGPSDGYVRLDQGAMHLIDGAQRLSMADNDCDFCDCFECKSRRRGGKTKCFCLSTSTHDLSLLQPGPRAYAKAARKYHSDNPGVTSLKGVKLFSRSASRGRGGPGGRGGGRDGGRGRGRGGGSGSDGSITLVGVLGAQPGEASLFGADAPPTAVDDWIASATAAAASGGAGAASAIFMLSPAEDGGDGDEVDVVADVSEAVDPVLAARGQAQVGAASLGAVAAPSELRAVLAELEAQRVEMAALRAQLAAAPTTPATPGSAASPAGAGGVPAAVSDASSAGTGAADSPALLTPTQALARARAAASHAFGALAASAGGVGQALQQQHHTAGLFSPISAMPLFTQHDSARRYERRSGSDEHREDSPDVLLAKAQLLRAEQASTEHRVSRRDRTRDITALKRVGHVALNVLDVAAGTIINVSSCLRWWQWLASAGITRLLWPRVQAPLLRIFLALYRSAQARAVGILAASALSGHQLALGLLERLARGLLSVSTSAPRSRDGMLTMVGDVCLDQQAAVNVSNESVAIVPTPAVRDKRLAAAPWRTTQAVTFAPQRADDSRCLPGACDCCKETLIDCDVCGNLQLLCHCSTKAVAPTLSAAMTARRSQALLTPQQALAHSKYEAKRQRVESEVTAALAARSVLVPCEPATIVGAWTLTATDVACGVALDDDSCDDCYLEDNVAYEYERSLLGDLFDEFANNEALELCACDECTLESNDDAGSLTVNSRVSSDAFQAAIDAADSDGGLNMIFGVRDLLDRDLVQLRYDPVGDSAIARRQHQHTASRPLAEDTVHEFECITVLLVHSIMWLYKRDVSGWRDPTRIMLQLRGVDACLCDVIDEVVTLPCLGSLGAYMLTMPYRVNSNVVGDRLTFSSGSTGSVTATELNGLFMLAGDKRSEGGSSSVSDAVASLLQLSDVTARALDAALSASRALPPGTALEGAVIIDLARSLGLSRPQKQTLMGLNAVVATIVHPALYPDRGSALQHFGGSRNTFNKYFDALSGLAVGEMHRGKIRRSGAAVKARTVPSGDAVRPVKLSLSVVNMLSLITSHDLDGACERRDFGDATLLDLTLPDAALDFVMRAAAGDDLVGVDLDELDVVMPLLPSDEGSGTIPLPLGSLSDDSDNVPALCDNGASLRVSCAKDVRGAIAETYLASDAGSLNVGNESAGLESTGSYVYLLERYGANGAGEIVLRRKKHTPDLMVQMVISEPTECKLHRYRFLMDEEACRTMYDASRNEIPLFMSSSCLGWLKVKAVTCAVEAAALIKRIMGGALMFIAAVPTDPVFASPSVVAIVADGAPAVVNVSSESVAVVATDATRDAGIVVPDADKGQRAGARFTSVRWADQLVPAAELLASTGDDSLLAPIGDGQATTGGLGQQATRKLRGVHLLRRMHVVLGHASVQRILQSLKASGRSDWVVTAADVDTFVREGCGGCETSKLRRRAFTLQTLEDHTPVPVGKKWMFDALKLRDPSREFGYLHIGLYVDVTSHRAFVFGTIELTAEAVDALDNRLRARVRPRHGDIWIFRRDSHPSHRSIELADLMADTQTHGEVAPGGVHEGVSLCEGRFMSCVPIAMAQLLLAPDLNESDFFTSFNTAVAASDYVTVPTRDPPASNVQLYLGRADWVPSPLLAYGCAGKALVHNDHRETKFDDHAVPCIYTGPALYSDSPIHCSVLDMNRHWDVDLGCAHFDERAIIARSHRDHPCHQPFNQPVGGVTPDPLPDTSRYYDPAEEMHPATKPDPQVDGLTELPHYTGRVWVMSMALPDVPFTVEVGSGDVRSGDCGGWYQHFQGAAHVHVRVDEKVGGYEHDWRRAGVRAWLLSLVASPHCRGLLIATECGPWSAIKFSKDGGPEPLFDLKHRDGKTGLDGIMPPAVDAAMVTAQFVADLLDEAARCEVACVLEHPVGQGADSLFHSKGCDLHSTLLHTTPVVGAMQRGSYGVVYTDRCMSGARTRKTTALVCSLSVLPHVQLSLGTLRCTLGRKGSTHVHGEPLGGRADDGKWRTSESEVYAPRLCELLVRAFVLAMRAPPQQGGSQAQSAGSTEAGKGTESTAFDANAPPVIHSTTTVFNIGDRVEVYWTHERRWYAGSILNTDTERVTMRGKRVTVATVQVKYDCDGKIKTHRLNNNAVRLAHELDHPTLNSIFTSAEDGDATADTLDISAGAVIMVEDLQIDLETAEVHNTWSMFMVDNDNKLVAAASLDKINARHWHEPRNEREYERSPQRSLWRTAKELKWDEYTALHMFEWVLPSTVDRKAYKIYNTLWVHKIKLFSDLTFNKLNPRWCLKGTGMDRDIHKSHAETLRMVTFRIILACKAGYYEFFCTFLLDCSNAFQSTRTDSESSNSPRLFCWPAPGFERRAPNGERMALEVLVGMQGRIDATLLFNRELFRIFAKAEMSQCPWDPQLWIYHKGPLTGTDASLTDILKSIASATDTSAQESPIGFAMHGWHVDDGTGLACDVGLHMRTEDNRVVTYINESIKTMYATTLCGWHGQRALGFLLQCYDAERKVTMSAPDAIRQLSEQLFAGESMFTPKHIMMPDILAQATGVVPDVGDPTRNDVLARMSMDRHALGVLIWASQAYPQAVACTNFSCGKMAFPSLDTHKHIRYQMMHLAACCDTDCATYGGTSCFGLEQPDVLLTPFGRDPIYYYHYFSDASNDLPSITGGVGMLAMGPCNVVAQRQQLTAPDSHTSEVVAGGTNLHFIIPTSGTLQFLHIQCGKPVPMYFDSKTTVFVSSSDSAVKRSAWILRRVIVLQEAEALKEITPIFLRGTDNVADACTKYLTYKVWRRFMNYVLNRLDNIDMTADHDDQS